LKIKLIFISFFLTIIIIVSSFNVASLNYKDNSNEKNIFYNNTINEIFNEIIETGDKILKIDQLIGYKNVQYWEHEVDGIQIKNDYILLHIDPYTNEIIDYIKKWRELNLDVPQYNFDDLQLKNIFWKEKIAFIAPEDLGHFYRFSIDQKFPVVCLEVRHINGSTILYDTNGVIIGCGIQAPYDQGLTMSGDCGDGYGDCWLAWRKNANFWLSQWCKSVTSLSLPSVEEISNYIQDDNITSFFEIGHSGGRPDRFQNRDGSYYWASQLKEDMANRSPMKFALLCSCEAMRDTGPDTLSYEFRKGETEGTVTVGYIGMSRCYGWSVSLEWQDRMFNNMLQYKTVKESFDEASAYYPIIANCVECVGDYNLSVIYKPDLESNSELNWTEIVPGSRIIDNITIINSGDSPSFLNWEIIEWPEWGNWSFNPSSGTNLHPDDGPLKIKITVEIPQEIKTTFTGEIKISNSEDYNDSCTIPISLTTIKNKSLLIKLNYIQFEFSEYNLRELIQHIVLCFS